MDVNNIWLCIVFLFGLPVISPQQQAQMPMKKKTFQPIKADIAIVKCQTCEKAIKNVYKEIKKFRQSSNIKSSEEEILAKVEKVCSPSDDSGEWISRLDIDTNGRLVEMGGRGKCEDECVTIAKACDDTIIDHDTDIGELLWKNELNLSQMINKICFSLTDVCPGKVKSSGKRADFPFQEMTEKEIEARKTMQKMNAARGPGMPGMEMYSREEVDQMAQQMASKEPADHDTAGGDHEQGAADHVAAGEQGGQSFSRDVSFLDMVKDFFSRAFAKLKSWFSFASAKSDL